VFDKVQSCEGGAKAKFEQPANINKFCVGCSKDRW
jgi:hypothetical protein